METANPLEALAPSIAASSLVLVVLLAAVTLVAFLVSARKTKAQKAHFERVHRELAPGKRVLFCGGIYGRVKAVEGDLVKVEVCPGTVLEVSRYAIQDIVAP